MLSQKWRCPSPQILLQSTCFCTMGIARPHAMGYANAAGCEGAKHDQTCHSQALTLADVTLLTL